jgi:hypothetical protein
MTDDETAQVNDFYTRAENALTNESVPVQNALANEIQMWEMNHVNDLDQGTRDQLNTAIDRLRQGGGDTSIAHYDMTGPNTLHGTEVGTSPTLTAIKSWWNDPKKLDPEILKAAAKKVGDSIPGGWIPWAIGLGLIVLLGTAGYAARNVRELKTAV